MEAGTKTMEEHCILACTPMAFQLQTVQMSLEMTELLSGLVKVRAKCYEGGWALGHMARKAFSKEGTKQSDQEVKDTEETECAQEA